LPELFTTLHAGLVIVLVEVAVRRVPLPRLCERLGIRLNLAPAPPDADRIHIRDLPPSAARQVRCTRRVADAWPFSQGPCLRRALVAGHLLRRFEPALRLGLAGAGEGVFAHAWLELNDRPLENVAAFSMFLQTPIHETS
jgi:hypothetical protein